MTFVVLGGNVKTSFLKVADGMVVQLWPVSVTQHYARDRGSGELD